MASIAELGQRPLEHPLQPAHAVEKVKILNSWKEIAVYLGRGVRTVQRWEEDLGLPVRRPRGKDRSAVFAFPAEIDEWLRERPSRAAKPSEHPDSFFADRERWEAMRKESRQLVLAVRESRGQLRAVVSALSQTITQIRATTDGAPSLSTSDLTATARYNVAQRNFGSL